MQQTDLILLYIIATSDEYGIIWCLTLANMMTACPFVHLRARERWESYKIKFNHTILFSNLSVGALSQFVRVFIKDDKSDVSNYRIATISSVILKMFE